MGITKSNLFTDEQNELAKLAKVFAHPARIAIIQHLIQSNACITGDLVEEIGLARAVPPYEGIMTSREGLYRILLAEGPEAADLDRLYGERRHRLLFEFAGLCGAGARPVVCLGSCAALAGALAWSRGLRARQAVPAAGRAAV